MKAGSKNTGIPMITPASPRANAEFFSPNTLTSLSAIACAAPLTSRIPSKHGTESDDQRDPL